MERLIKLQEAAKILGVGMSTLRAWDESGQFPSIRTKGGHRRYRLSEIEKFQGVQEQTEVGPTATAVYLRVSSHEQKQKGDLERQKGRVLDHCSKKSYIVEHIFEEMSSGMSDSRAKLHRLFKLAVERKICRVVIEHRDRLCRFNFAVFEVLFSSHGVQVEWCEDVLPKSYEAEMVEDMISLMSSLSARVYGRRSAENAKKKREAKADAQSV